ncbi:hypothetical protein [Paraburkholderia caribensis]|uniref:hypothetical protein n=1 Tax=Paraburkholderia caribensis TaxID=75105 RepID=UPI001CC6F929|nr:hypothetical protein [Paraburkholderia caribensis]
MIAFVLCAVSMHTKLVRAAMLSLEDIPQEIAHVTEAAFDSKAVTFRIARNHGVIDAKSSFLDDWFVGPDNSADFHGKIADTTLSIEYMPHVSGYSNRTVRFGVGLDTLDCELFPSDVNSQQSKNSIIGLHGINLSAIARYEHGRFGVFGKIGCAAANRYSFKDAKLHEMGYSLLPTLGAGIAYQLTKNIEMACDWQRLYLALDTFGNNSTDLYSIGLRFKI